MREFTISTKKQNTKQDKHTQPSSLYSDANKEFNQKQDKSVNEDLLQEREGDNLQTQEFSKDSKKGENNIISAATLFIAFIGIGLLTINIVLGARYFNQKHRDEDNNILGVRNDSQENDTLPINMMDRIIYTDNYNIFIAAKDGSDSKQLTHYPNQNGSELHEIELINDRTIGYFRCAGLALNPMCEIITLDIVDGNTVIEEKLSSDQYIDLLTWVDSHTYAYSTKIPSEQKYILTYKDSFKREKIAEYQVLDRQRENSFIEDSHTLQFSPNGQKLLFDDSRSRGGFDYTVYIYSLSGNILNTIQYATQPVWLDDSTVLYRSYSNTEAGYLYKRNIESETSEKIKQSVNAAYNPTILGNSILYWENVKGGMSYMLNENTHENIPLLAYSAYPVWLSEYEVILVKTKNCLLDECDSVGTTEFETQFKPDYFFILDLATKQKTKISSPINYLKNGIITWYHPHL